MLDLTKPVQTRDGRKARIICTDRKAPVYTVVVLVADNDGLEDFFTYTRSGVYVEGATRSEDLVNVPQRHVHADLIIAWANGAEIEFREFIDQPWLPTVQPEWYRAFQYRVKPA